jgi:predicted branched-subunit amino acid permease
LGTILGVIAGGTLPDPARWGLDLAPTLIFVILLPAFWRSRQDLLPWVVAGVAAIVTERMLAGPRYLLAGAAAGVIILLWQNREGAADAP